MAHQCAQNLHVGKMVARGVWFVAVAGAAMRTTFALRAATTAPPIFATPSMAFVFAGPRSLELLGPLLPWELIYIEHLISKSHVIRLNKATPLAKARACA